jgi:chromosome segregation ATPase
MAKPLATSSDALKANPKLAQLVRTRLEETATQPDATVETPAPGQPDPWLSNAVTTEDSSLLSSGPSLLEPPSSQAPSKLSNSVFLQVDSLRSENARLRNTIRELEAAIEELEQVSRSATVSRVRELQALVEEKDAAIRDLHKRLNGGEAPDENEASGERVTVGALREREEEMLALSEDLDRDRKQLVEDEKALMQQMKEMEIQMSRERAEVARQRSEVQRLHNELQHELELAQRDAGLRERLAPLQRRQQDATGRRGATQKPEQTGGAQQGTAKPQEEGGAGFLGRLFGRK